MMFSPTLNLLNLMKPRARGLGDTGIQDFQTAQQGQLNANLTRQKAVQDQANFVLDQAQAKRGVGLQGELDQVLQDPTQVGSEKVASLLMRMGQYGPAVSMMKPQAEKELARGTRQAVIDDVATRFLTAETQEDWDKTLQDVYSSYANDPRILTVLDQLVPKNIGEKERLLRVSNKTANTVKPQGYEVVNEYKDSYTKNRLAGDQARANGNYELAQYYTEEANKYGQMYNAEVAKIGRSDLSLSGGLSQNPDDYIQVTESGRPEWKDGVVPASVPSFVLDRYNKLFDTYTAKTGEGRARSQKDEEDVNEVYDLLRTDQQYKTISNASTDLYPWIKKAKDMWAEGLKSGTAFTGLKSMLGDAITGSDFANLAGRSGAGDLVAKIKNTGADKLTDSEALKVVNAMVNAYNGFQDDMVELRDSVKQKNVTGRQLKDNLYKDIVERVYRPMKKAELFSIDQKGKEAIPSNPEKVKRVGEGKVFK